MDHGIDQVLKQKRLRNRAYYEANRAKILARRASTPTRCEKRNLAPFARVWRGFFRGVMTPLFRIRKIFKKSAPIFTPERLILSTFILASTLFLVRESAAYLADSGESGALAKALLAEIAVLILSAVQFSSKKMHVFRCFLLVSFFSYTVWTLAGSAVRGSQSVLSKLSALELKSQRLTSALAQKQIRGAAALAIGRVSLARKYDLESEILRRELDQVETDRGAIPARVVILSSAIQSVVFRILVLLTNSILIIKLRGSELKKGGRVATVVQLKRAEIF